LALVVVDEVTGETRRAVVRLDAAPESCRAARAAVRDALEQWHLSDLVDTATLLASELVTNAVLHGRSPMELQVEQVQERVRVTVLDGAVRPPARRRYGLGAGTGRGLGLVETMAATWGWSRAADPFAKSVWFELSESVDRPQGEGALYGDDWLALVDDL
jgi:anti-sigma regulatory factor (Ser/Thr protein kinase)